MTNDCDGEWEDNVHQRFDDELRELDFLAADIHSKIGRTHLNVRVVYETVDPMVDEARSAARSSDPASRAFVGSVIDALRDFDESL